ncbi:MAG: YggS family pyridoxal phosphate-dependent enzyme [Pseudomonadota bacterium]
MPDELAEHEALRTVQASITAAQSKYGREAGSVKLVAVSKRKDESDIRPTLAAGQRIFGENRVQEAMSKWPALRTDYPDVELHLIGPLQSNKSEEAVATFDAIQSVDREKIVRTLAAAMRDQGRDLPCLVQVNTGLEEQKSGIDPRETGAFLEFCKTEGLTIEGLMCIPPTDDNPGPHFALMRDLAEEQGLPVRSMGMSGDYETAIQMGATHVRVGSAIFGARD